MTTPRDALRALEQKLSNRSKSLMEADGCMPTVESLWLRKRADELAAIVSQMDSEPRAAEGGVTEAVKLLRECVRNMRGQDCKAAAKQAGLPIGAGLWNKAIADAEAFLSSPAEQAQDSEPTVSPTQATVIDPEITEILKVLRDAWGIAEVKLRHHLINQQATIYQLSQKCLRLVAENEALRQPPKADAEEHTT